MSIRDLLGLGGGTDPEPARSGTSSDAESIRRIVRSLDQLDPERAREIAALAFVLSRVAHADLHISDVEIEAMERIVMDEADLPEDQAVLVVEIARRQNMLFGGTDNFLVTRELKSALSLEQKERLLHCLFAVSAADDAISGVEEGRIAQVASELGVDRRDMVRIRAAYRDKRSIMKDLPG